MSNYKWHFALTDGGTEEGFADAGMTHFASDPHHYIAREIIQNSLDAKDESKKGEPVVVEFKLFKVPTEEAIPDLDGYKKILNENIESNKSAPDSKKFFTTALKKINNKDINVLSISDSSTVGIKDINKEVGRWHGLIKMKGKGAQQQRNQGGTFGIGKSAPFVCSELRTVLYNTKNVQGESAFIWKSMFTTHGTPKKTGDGFYCNVSKDDNGETHTNGITDSKIKPSFINRDHNGADVFILGFIKPEKEKQDKKADPWNVILQRVVLDNYFVALYDNELRVIIKDEIKGRSYEINSANVIDKMKIDYKFRGNDSNYPFLDAYVNAKPIETSIEGLGKCKLFIQLNNDYVKKHVAYMRLLKMLVYSQQNPNLSTAYSALFICTNKPGNTFLSKCEGPTHSSWKHGQHKDSLKAKTVLLRISKFINSSLRDMTVDDYSKESILGGLPQFTYIDESENPGDNGDPNQESDEGDDSFDLKSITMNMNDLKYIKPNPSRKKKRKRKVKVEDGYDAGDEQGEGSGGREDEGGNGGDKPGDKGFGDLDGRKDGEWKIKKLPKSQYDYRCFQEAGSTEYKLVISTKNEKKCQISFYANGVDVDKNEEIIIERAIEEETGEELKVNKNIISDVDTYPDPKIIKITTKEDRKFGVELELYA
jgi:hypothetical protein